MNPITHDVIEFIIKKNSIDGVLNIKVDNVKFTDDDINYIPDFHEDNVEIDFSKFIKKKPRKNFMSSLS